MDEEFDIFGFLCEDEDENAGELKMLTPLWSNEAIERERQVQRALLEILACI